MAPEYFYEYTLCYLTSSLLIDIWCVFNRLLYEKYCNFALICRRNSQKWNCVSEDRVICNSDHFLCSLCCSIAPSAAARSPQPRSTVQLIDFCSGQEARGSPAWDGSALRGVPWQLLVPEEKVKGTGGCPGEKVWLPQETADAPRPALPASQSRQGKASRGSVVHNHVEVGAKIRLHRVEESEVQACEGITNAQRR